LNDGGTQKAKESIRLEMDVQATSLDVSEMLATIRTSCDGERNLSSEVPDVTLPRKASSEK
jgi:hypothetical protein